MRESDLNNEKNIEDKIESAFSEIEFLEKKHPQKAFYLLMNTVVTINQATTQKPYLIKKLDNWTNKIQTFLSNLAKKIGADSFSISAGMPAGISVTVTWKT